MQSVFLCFWPGFGTGLRLGLNLPRNRLAEVLQQIKSFDLSGRSGLRLGLNFALNLRRLGLSHPQHIRRLLLAHPPNGLQPGNRRL